MYSDMPETILNYEVYEYMDENWDWKYYKVKDALDEVGQEVIEYTCKYELDKLTEFTAWTKDYVIVLLHTRDVLNDIIITVPRNPRTP